MKLFFFLIKLLAGASTTHLFFFISLCFKNNQTENMAYLLPNMPETRKPFYNTTIKFTQVKIKSTQ